MSLVVRYVTIIAFFVMAELGVAITYGVHSHVLNRGGNSLVEAVNSPVPVAEAEKTGAHESQKHDEAHVDVAPPPPGQKPVAAARPLAPEKKPVASNAPLLLPDVAAKKLGEVFVTSTTSTIPERELRFESVIMNVGDGPIEIHALNDASMFVTDVSQHVYRTDGTFMEKIVGTFIYHEGHEHWHVDNYTNFDLYTYGAGGVLKDKVASTGKMSFCLYDATPVEIGFPRAPTKAVYQRDCLNKFQGISPGWEDTYTARVIAQRMSLTNISDGRYAFVAHIDPMGQFMDKDPSNNKAITYLEIKGMVVSVLGEP